MSLRFLLIVAALTVIVYGLVRLSAVVLPVLIALLLASLLAPPANWLHRKRVPKLLATAIVVVGALLLVIGLLASIVPGGGRAVRRAGPAGEGGLPAGDGLSRPGPARDQPRRRSTARSTWRSSACVGASAASRPACSPARRSSRTCSPRPSSR
ncbi:MAG: AI-2E family transporter [Thermoleophilaceae bacterium]